MKKFIGLAAVAAFSSIMVSSAWAGTWKQNNVGWWFDNGNGTYPASTWQWIDGNNDGIAECYYFDRAGYMLANTSTPDGYQVGADGAWISGNSSATSQKQVALDEARAASSLGKHDYYKYCTQEQANQADAVARNIATRVLSDNSLTTDLAKIRKAASIIYREYNLHNTYGTDANKYYRGPYGVFIAGVYTCAGGARALGRVLDFMGYDWEHANPNQWTHQWCIVNMDGKTGYADAMGYGCGFGTHPYISGDMSQVTEDMMRGLY